MTPTKRQYEEVSVKLESEQIQWEPDEKLSQVMNFLEEVEKQSERSPVSDKRTDKSAIIGMEIELEERKNMELLLQKALQEQKQQLQKEREVFELQKKELTQKEMQEIAKEKEKHLQIIEQLINEKKKQQEYIEGCQKQVKDLKHQHERELKTVRESL